MGAAVPIIFFIIFIPAIILIYVAQSDRQKNLINEKIESLGGSVTNIERGSFFTGLGPFHVVGKGRVVYKITYTMNGRSHEGWVRFGGLFGADWRL